MACVFVAQVSITHEALQCMGWRHASSRQRMKGVCAGACIRAGVPLHTTHAARSTLHAHNSHLEYPRTYFRHAQPHHVLGLNASKAHLQLSHLKTQTWAQACWQRPARAVPERAVSMNRVTH